MEAIALGALKQRVATIEATIDAHLSAIPKLEADRDALLEEIRRAESEAYRTATGMRLDQIELSATLGIYEFGWSAYYADYLRGLPKTPIWAAWNDRVFKTDDIMNGEKGETPVRVTDFPEYAAVSSRVIPTYKPWPSEPISPAARKKLSRP